MQVSRPERAPQSLAGALWSRVLFRHELCRRAGESQHRVRRPWAGGRKSIGSRETTTPSFARRDELRLRSQYRPPLKTVVLGWQAPDQSRSRRAGSRGAGEPARCRPAATMRIGQGRFGGRRVRDVETRSPLLHAEVRVTTLSEGRRLRRQAQSVRRARHRRSPCGDAGRQLGDRRRSICAPSSESISKRRRGRRRARLRGRRHHDGR
jgi:hypothetical protein